MLLLHRLKVKVKSYRPSVLSKPAVTKELSNLQKQYVMAPADKAANNVIFVCKKWYMDQVIKELHVEDNNTNDSAYREVRDKTPDAIVEEHSEMCTFLELPHIGKRDQRILWYS